MLSEGQQREGRRDGWMEGLRPGNNRMEGRIDGGFWSSE